MTLTFEFLGNFVFLPAVMLVAVFGFYRLVKGPTVADRVVSLDLMSTVGMAAIAILAMVSDIPALLDVAAVIALTAFLGTIAFAYYIELRRS